MKDAQYEELFQAIVQIGLMLLEKEIFTDRDIQKMSARWRHALEQKKIK